MSPERTVNDCPKCGTEVSATFTTGPATAQVSPCGCTLHPDELLEWDVASDGGRVVEYRCDECGPVLECTVDEIGQRRCKDCGSTLETVAADGGVELPAEGSYYCTHCESRFPRADYDEPSTALKRARDCALSHSEKSDIRFDPELEDEAELMADGGRDFGTPEGRLQEAVKQLRLARRDVGHPAQDAAVSRAQYLAGGVLRELEEEDDGLDPALLADGGSRRGECDRCGTETEATLLDGSFRCPSCKRQVAKQNRESSRDPDQDSLGNYVTDGGREYRPVDDIKKECPNCESLDLEVATVASREEHRCRTCGAEFDQPELRRHPEGFQDVPPVQNRRPMTDGGRELCLNCGHPYDRTEHDRCPACENSSLDEFATDGGEDVLGVHARLCELAIADGDVPQDGSGLDGVWTRTVPAPNRDRDWQVALNGETGREVTVQNFPEDGLEVTVDPARAMVYLKNWPVAVLSPTCGSILVEKLSRGPRSLEDELLRDVESALLEAGENIARTVPEDLAAAEAPVGRGDDA